MISIMRTRGDGGTETISSVAGSETKRLMRYTCQHSQPHSLPNFPPNDLFPSILLPLSSLFPPSLLKTCSSHASSRSGQRVRPEVSAGSGAGAGTGIGSGAGTWRLRCDSTVAPVAVAGRACGAGNKMVRGIF